MNHIKSNSMVVFPNAKINLGLNITEKRKDGFHNIETVFYPIGITDILEINKSHETCYKNTEIIIEKGDLQKNLCYKAYQILQKEYNLPPVNIHLHKKIPLGSGLGGGSSDASHTLLVLNQLFNLQLNKKDLANYAKQLGADCAFFMHNTPKLAYGTGDQLTKISVDLSGFYLMVIVPNIFVSTAKAYKNVKIKKNKIPINKIIHKYPIEEWKELLINDFEDTVFEEFPLIGEIKDYLYHKGAVYASLSGSGSSLYGIFKTKPQIDSYLKKFTNWVELL